MFFYERVDESEAEPEDLSLPIEKQLAKSWNIMSNIHDCWSKLRQKYPF